MGTIRQITLVGCAVLLLGSAQSGHCFAQGAILSAAGPVHRGMGGASTAAPTSVNGAMYWNPATISGLQQSELEFGVDVLFTDHRFSSSVGPLSGSTDADPGTFPIPNVGWAFRLDNHPAVTFGLGIQSVAGFKTNLPADPTNPILSPAPLGLGQITSEASFLQISPVLSLAVSDQLSIAVGPTITTAQIGVEPFIFDSANADGTYSSGRASRYHWGGGVQAGVYYIHQCCWHFGASIKSPSWMEEFEFYSEDELGLPRELRADVDLPMIVSLGLAYSGCEDWLFALDARFIDYKNAAGFGDPATFDATGRVQGLDWSSVYAIAMGVQRRLGERCLLRGGYTYNQTPIRNSESFFNTATPLIYEHMLSIGGSCQLNERFAVNIAYSHYLENKRVGPVVLPGVGAIPGSSATNEMSANIISFGIVMR